MKYRLGDICTIAKGATGIMKAVPGPYPMVTLAEERKQHDEYQFDAAAVIVPLISSTGHGHASIKRVHYQEGRFALGTILCAVIPKDETVLNPRYLFVYLQQFKDSVLVPLMKGAANVSLPLNKLASLEIEVPTLAKQQEVIDLAHVLTGQKNDLEALLDAQEGDTVKLRQALLREAMQGQLLPQDPTDEPAALLLKKLQAAKAATGKGGKGKAGALFAEEPADGPFAIPDNWVWCTLNSCSINFDGQRKPIALSDRAKRERIYDYYGASGVIDRIDGYTHEGEFLLIGEDGANLVSRSTPIAFIASGKFWVNNHAHVIGTIDRITLDYLCYYLNSLDLKPFITGGFQPKLSQGNLNIIPVPFPPLAEQRRIVAKLEQLMQHCDALEQRIRESRRLAQQLLQTALREALAPPAGTEPAVEAEPALAPAEASAPGPSRQGRPRRPATSLANPPLDLFDEFL